MKRAFESLSLAAAKELMVSVLATGKRFRFTAHGISMSPFIRNGDRVELETITTVSVGDVVAATLGEKLLVHRVIRKNGTRYQLKGDHLIGADGWFEQETLLGKVVAVYHDEKKQPIGITRFKKTISFLSQTGLLPISLRIYAKIFKKVEKKS